MTRPTPLVVEITAPFAGRKVAISTDPDDCRLILRRLAARKRREADEVLDPATAAIIRTEAERYERLISMLTQRPAGSGSEAPTRRGRRS